MRAAIFNGPRSISVGDRPDPVIVEPTDAIVRVVLGCVCGSDLWYFRGETPHAVGSIGHEFIGIVEEVGSAVTGVNTGQLVVAPFVYCDGTCPNCLVGMTAHCRSGGAFGNGTTTDGGQGQFVRVPFAGTSLVPVPGAPSGHSIEILRSLLALSDVMCTGHHAAVSARVEPGDTVAVVGDGAVGLSAVLASRRLGATRIIALSRNPSRQKLAKEFGATDIVIERGDDAIAAVLELTDGVGVDAALECVGTGQSMTTALGVSRPGATVGVVGAPHGIGVSFEKNFWRGVGWQGGVAPARAYIPELMRDVLDGVINPGLVFDFETDLDGIQSAYEAMDERRAIKSLIRIGSL